MDGRRHHLVNAAVLRDMSTDAAGRDHAAIPPPLIRWTRSPRFAPMRALSCRLNSWRLSSDAAPFFEPIFDLVAALSPGAWRCWRGRRCRGAAPCRAGVTKAALNVAWSTDAPTANSGIRWRWPSMTCRRAPSVAPAARAVSAAIRKTRRARGSCYSVKLMQAIGAPLRDILELGGHNVMSTLRAGRNHANKNCRCEGWATGVGLDGKRVVGRRGA